MNFNNRGIINSGHKVSMDPGIRQHHADMPPAAKLSDQDKMKLNNSKKIIKLDKTSVLSSQPGKVLTLVKKQFIGNSTNSNLNDNNNAIRPHLSANHINNNTTPANNITNTIFNSNKAINNNMYRNTSLNKNGNVITKPVPSTSSPVKPILVIQKISDMSPNLPNKLSEYFYYK